MDVVNSGMVAGIFSTGVMIIVVILILVCLIGGFFLYQQRVQRYKQFKVTVWQKDGFGQLTEKYDDAGIFTDKTTQKKRLWLKRNKVDLNADNIPFIPTRGKRNIYLLQTGLKNFRFIRPDISDEYINLSVGEEDVNWAITSFDMQQKQFGKMTLMQYMPFMVLAFISIVILILFVYLFKQFGTIKELIVQIQILAQEIAKAKAGTVVV